MTSATLSAVRWRLAALAAALLLALTLATPARADVPPQAATRSASLTRDDLGITCFVPRPTYLRLVRDLKLTPAAQEGRLDVKAPFTLRLEEAGRVDVYVFTTGGVRHNGALCLPQNPAALAAFYQEDDEGFLTKAYRLLGQELGFSAEQVAAVELTRSRFEVISMRLTDPATIATLLAEQADAVVLPLGSDANPPNPGGGFSYEMVYLLRDGSRVGIRDAGGPIRLQRGGEERLYWALGNSQPTRRALVDAFPGLPTLTVKLGDGAPELVQTAFSYNSQTKQTQGEPPLAYGENPRVYLPIGGDNAARVALSGQPSQVTAQIYRIEAGKQNACRSATVGSDGRLALPGEPGDYGVKVRAVFPAGWAEYFFGFAVSDLPAFFDSIPYGNASGGVTVTRDDLGRTVTGGQNRQYVELLQRLDLVPADGAASGLSPVKKPVTLTFSHDGSPDLRASFTAQSDLVLLGGRPYRARNPDAFDALYAPSSFERGESLLEDTKGFLAADATTLGALYPLMAEDIDSITTVEQMMYRRSVSGDGANATYGFALSELATVEHTPDQFPTLLGQLSSMLLARETQNADAFDYNTYTAYDIRCKDGRRFVLDRRLLLDGQPTGYYAIPTDDRP